jgi:DNA-binding NarL/FixJ family response regulator
MKNVKGDEQRMGNAIRIRMRMKEKSEQIDQEERERKIVSLMQQGFRRAEIAKTLGLTSDEVYQVTRMYRIETTKGSGGGGKAIRIKGLL